MILSFVFLFFFFVFLFFFQAEDGIRDLVRSRGLGDVYKRQVHGRDAAADGRGKLDRKFTAIQREKGIEAAIIDLSLIHI